MVAYQYDREGSIGLNFAFEEGGCDGYVSEFDGDILAGIDVHLL